MSRTFTQTDLELLDKFCETCLDFVSPLLFREIEGRGLGYLVNYLPNNTEQAKAVVRARMAKAGNYFGDEQIDQIAGWITRLNFLQKKLAGMNMADPHKTIPILDEMKQLSDLILNYYTS